ncbi:MAG: YdcF family protein [Cytophagia bacterium]|nr:YdcF family protein [Cytophagia bacterium]
MHTAHLYKLGLIKKVILSGGIGKILEKSEPEAIQLKRSLMVMGVPDSVIYTDPSSDNTYENAMESKKIIDSLGIPVGDCLLVTSAFHMRRARACFKKAGMDIDYFTCDFRSSPRSFTPDILLVPRLEGLLIWQKLLKEWVGMVVYKMVGYI